MADLAALPDVADPEDAAAAEDSQDEYESEEDNGQNFMAGFFEVFAMTSTSFWDQFAENAFLSAMPRRTHACDGCYTCQMKLKFGYFRNALCAVNQVKWEYFKNSRSLLYRVGDFLVRDRVFGGVVCLCVCVWGGGGVQCRKRFVSVGWSWK